MCYCVAKGLIGLAGLEPPPGIYAYELGLPVWVFEGAIIPGSCLVSSRQMPYMQLAPDSSAFPQCALGVSTVAGFCCTNGPFPTLGSERASAGCILQPTCQHSVTPALQMSVWAAAAVGAVKVPLYVSLWGRGDPSLSLLYRVTRAIGISAMSVLTTAACHANIRRAFRGRVRRLLQQQRQQQKADDGRAVAPHSKKVD